MKPIVPSFGINRRALLSTLAVLPALSAPLFSVSAAAQTATSGATLSGMTVEEFDAEAKKWLAAAKDARWKRPYTDLTYQPMQEVMSYLRANGYKTYIVTGGGQDFVRVYSERVYGIPPEQVVGSAGQTSFGYDKDGKPILIKKAPCER
jgi:phosphoglycolate phosphatase-like HAD superfamily hydrolase